MQEQRRNYEVPSGTLSRKDDALQRLRKEKVQAVLLSFTWIVAASITIFSSNPNVPHWVRAVVFALLIAGAQMWASEATYKRMLEAAVRQSEPQEFYP